MAGQDSRKSNRDLVLFSAAVIACIFIVSFAIIYVPKIYEQYPLIQKYTPNKLAENAIKLLPFLGSLILFALYKNNKKSIKAFNDFIIAIIGTSALYAIFCLGNDDLIKNVYYQTLSSLFVFTAKLLLMMCSISKVIITFLEFKDERKKEIDSHNDKNFTSTAHSVSISKKSTIILGLVALIIYTIEKKGSPIQKIISKEDKNDNGRCN